MAKSPSKTGGKGGKPEADHNEDDWNEADDKGGSNDHNDDDQDDGDHVTGPDDATAFSAGAALTDRQRAGLDAIDPEHDDEQAEHKAEMPNMQTDHEAENTLDPVSSAPEVAISPDTPLTGLQTGQKPTDMTGRPPMLSGSDEELVPAIRKALTKAHADDTKNGTASDRIGWRTPQDIGISGAVLERVMRSGAPIEMEEVPGGAFFPETGRRYRFKG